MIKLMKRDKKIELVEINYLNLKRKLLQSKLETRRLINKNQEEMN